MVKKMRNHVEDSSKAKMIDEAGCEFLEELIRHHLGCERPTHTIPRIASEASDRVQAIIHAGDEFIARLIKYFHHNDSFVEDVPAGDYEQSEHAA